MTLFQMLAIHSMLWAQPQGATDFLFVHSCPPPKTGLCLTEPLQPDRRITLLRRDKSGVCKAKVVEQFAYSPNTEDQEDEVAPMTRLEVSSWCPPAADFYVAAVIDGGVSGYRLLTLDKIQEENRIASIDRKAREEGEILQDAAKGYPDVFLYPMPKSDIYLAWYRSTDGSDFGRGFIEINKKLTMVGEFPCARLGTPFKISGDYYMEISLRSCTESSGVERFIFQVTGAALLDVSHETQ